MKINRQTMKKCGNRVIWVLLCIVPLVVITLAIAAIVFPIWLAECVMKANHR